MQRAIQGTPKVGFGLVALMGVLGCSSGQDPELLLVSPGAPEVRIGERVGIGVRCLEETQGEPDWEVVEPYGGGLLQTRGFRTTYVAPPVAGTYHVAVRVPLLKGAPLRQEVAVRVRAQVQVEPASALLPPGGTQAFSLRQKGLPRGLVTWTVLEPEGGSISPDGRYLAPAARGIYRVVGSCPEDPGTQVMATITVR